MSAVAVSSQGEKAAIQALSRRLLKREALIYCPRCGEGDRNSSRRGPRTGGKDSGEARRVSAREPPRKRRRNWARRAAARPRASCVRLGLLRRRGRRGPFRSPGDDSSLLAMGTRGTELERRELEALPGLGSPYTLFSPLRP